MYTVELFMEEEFDAVLTIEAESLSETTKQIKKLEEDEKITIDYVKVTEGENYSWYLVEDDLTFSVPDEEVAESLDFDYDEDIADLVSESGWFEDLLAEESELLDEQLKKRVNSKGQVSRVKSRKVRSRRATRTTGMSKSALKRRARKASKTRKRDAGGTRRAGKKRKKAMRRRRQMGIR